MDSSSEMNNLHQGFAELGLQVAKIFFRKVQKLLCEVLTSKAFQRFPLPPRYSPGRLVPRAMSPSSCPASPPRERPLSWSSFRGGRGARGKKESVGMISTAVKGGLQPRLLGTVLSTRRWQTTSPTCGCVKDGGVSSSSELVEEEDDRCPRFLPPRGRELLAAVKLGLPGAKEEFEKQQLKFNNRFDARARARARATHTHLRETFASKDPKGYYKALGLEGHEGSATPAEIAKAFRKRAKTFHPDAGGSKESFIFLSKAYKVLNDPQSRDSYDKNSMY